MTSGWIAFLILLAYLAGFSTALGFGQWFVNRNKNNKKGEKR